MNAITTRKEWDKLTPTEKGEIRDKYFQDNDYARGLVGWEAVRENWEMEQNSMNKVWKLDVKEHGGWVEFYSVPSSRDPEKPWIVSRKASGEWGCSCPRWIYHREPCKHIQAVEALLNTFALSGKTAGEMATLSEMSAETAKAVSRFAGLVGDLTGPVEAEDPETSRVKFLEVEVKLMVKGEIGETFPILLHNGHEVICQIVPVSGRKAKIKANGAVIEVVGLRAGFGSEDRNAWIIKFEASGKFDVASRKEFSFTS